MPMPEQKPGRSKQDAPARLAWGAYDLLRSRLDFNGPIHPTDPKLGRCRLYVGGKSAGYGWMYLGGGRKNPVNVYTHRLTLFHKTGRWGETAMHSCDVRACCNEAHLAWATKRANSQDALKKGRAYIGEMNSNAKLTEQAVLYIRERRAAGEPLKAIAAKLGVSKSLVSSVARRKGWTHV